MREILFRGKTTATGNWICGCLGRNTSTDAPQILPEGHYSYSLVIPETVGQYTGLADKNGKKIFEGDVVRYYGTYALEVYIDNGHTQVRWFDTVTKSECSKLFFGDDEAYGECEIIGNIHDNPELLKGGAE